ncbi:GGDEF domain-containing protein [Nocardioides sp. BP30]|uniref:GGDEF domain-containing protein n=1 Tax=Nocardioides sp. BP30 TaxID=3036374 RepID=UPI00246882ED|nr:GGDEF domain-containing protein [Nocardioides sp. BP30]WGL53640.1 GGDEF domain-containing protein [Nocardioides sp. BP30]
MDIDTLRITFSVIAGVLVVLFYVGAYLPTRAPFSGWWTLALLLFLLSSAAYLANGTAAQAALNPLGNGLAVAGAEAAWYGARSLRTQPWRWEWLVPGPLLALLAGVLDDPGHDVWAGGLTFLVLITAAFGAITRELVLAAFHPDRPARTLSVSDVLIRALALASVILTLFYAGRALAFVAEGPDSELFRQTFGSVPTTVLLVVQLVTVSFSMSALSTQQQIDDLHRRAVFDQLTGLMRAQEFRDRAAVALPRLTRGGEVTILAMADLDHFKLVNDELGHAAGDDVLRAFGWSARTVLGQQALCGRLGGEEFALLFTSTSRDYAEGLLHTLVAEFQHTVQLADGRVPTVSIGMVEAGEAEPLTSVLERADKALYRAKSEGRSRVVRA